MTVTYYDAGRGLVRELRTEGARIPFGDALGPSLYVRRGGRRIPIPSGGSVDGVYCALRPEVSSSALLLHLMLENRSARPLAPEALGLQLGVQLDRGGRFASEGVLAPALLCAEKTRFLACLKAPEGHALAVTCGEPLAAWELVTEAGEEQAGGCSDGARTTLGLLLLSAAPNPCALSVLPGGARLTRTLRLTPLESLGGISRLAYRLR